MTRGEATTIVRNLYSAVLGRFPTTQEQLTWVPLIMSGTSSSSVLTRFLQSTQEYIVKHPIQQQEQVKVQPVNPQQAGLGKYYPYILGFIGVAVIFWAISKEK